MNPLPHALPFPTPTTTHQAEYSFYFDTGGRRRCYIAPERFFYTAPASAAAVAAGGVGGAGEGGAGEGTPYTGVRPTGSVTPEMVGWGAGWGAGWGRG